MESLNDNKTLSEILKEKIREHKFSIKKLSELTHISKRHLENLISGRYEKMPPSPYLHGYIKRLGEVLNFDAEKYWQELKSQDMIFSSGKYDTMPQNRFAYQKINPKIITIFVVIVLLIVYFVFNYNRIFGAPILIISDPQSNLINVTSSNYTLRGVVKNADFLYVNNQKINFSPDGSFSQDLILSPGLNTFNIKAVKFLGQTKSLNKSIYLSVLNLLQNTTSSTSTLVK